MLRNLGFGEIALILLVLVLIFGAAKLPNLGKSMGEAIRGFKQGMKDESDEKKQ
jgi:sec-independent protein translocase protein TatA